MFNLTRRSFGIRLIATGMALALAFAGEPAYALEVGDPAPAFTLPGTNGRDVSLAQFRGKQWVLLEFYGADFAPT